MKTFVLRYWPLAVLCVFVIAILAMSRYAENRKEANKNSAHQSSPSTPISPDDASQTSENADKAEHPPSWVDTFAWPEGATVWALFLTLLVIAWQSAETREAAKAARDSAEATLRSVKLQEGQLRQWVNTNDDWDVTWQTTGTKETILMVAFGVINPTKMPLTLETIRTIRGDEIRDELVTNVLLPKEGHEVKISKVLSADELTSYKQQKLILEFSLVVDFIDNCGDSFTQTLEYSCIPTLDGAKEIRLLKVERKPRDQQQQKAN